MNERRRFSPEEKMKIVLEGLSGTIEMSELCRKYQIKQPMGKLDGKIEENFGKNGRNLGNLRDSGNS